MTAWYCIRTATRQEQRVVDGLHDLAYQHRLELDVYLPCETRWNRLARVRTIKHVPMLPGYLFLRIEPDHLWRVDGLEGVYQILGWATRRTERDAARLENFVGELRAAEADGDFDKTGRNKRHPKMRHKLTHGQKVRVLDGSFAGLIGEIVALNGTDRITVLMSLFGRATPVELDAKEAEAQDKAPAEAA
jgi:transcription antitermination factor NusG